MTNDSLLHSMWDSREEKACLYLYLQVQVKISNLMTFHLGMNCIYKIICIPQSAFEFHKIGSFFGGSIEVSYQIWELSMIPSWVPWTYLCHFSLSCLNKTILISSTTWKFKLSITTVFGNIYAVKYWKSVPSHSFILVCKSEERSYLESSILHCHIFVLPPGLPWFVAVFNWNSFLQAWDLIITVPFFKIFHWLQLTRHKKTSHPEKYCQSK